jgi:hydroxymethylglutaryl-CoA lyase
MDIRQVSLADTAGSASAETIAAIVKAVLKKHGHIEIGVHLHSRPEEAEAKVLAAIDAGCRRFDSAIGGLGGCPFASDTLTGNIPTAAVLSALKKRSLVPPVQSSLENLERLTQEIATHYSTESIQ